MADKYTFFYGDTDAEKKRHLVQRSETPLSLVTETRYDAYGNPTWNITKHKTESPFVQTYTEYAGSGNYVAKVTDAQGYLTSTETDLEKGLVLSVTDAARQKVRYQYDAANRITRAETTAGGKSYLNAYTYAKDRLATVSHNTTGSTPDVTYTFETDALGNQTKVKVGTQTLSTNVYTTTGDKLLTRVDYGNGGKVHYTYDSFKRTSGIRYDGATASRFTYEYGANGAASERERSALCRRRRQANERRGLRRAAERQ